MTNSQRLSSVRNAVRMWIAERHADTSDVIEPASEAMLIRDGFFCGRRFRFQNYHAVWFLEEDELKIRDLDGNAVVLLATDEIDRLARAWDERMTASDTAEVRTLSIASHLAAQQMAAQQMAAQHETGIEGSAIRPENPTTESSPGVEIERRRAA
jgi:hypothetical protein